MKETLNPVAHIEGQPTADGAWVSVADEHGTAHVIPLNGDKLAELYQLVRELYLMSLGLSTHTVATENLQPGDIFESFGAKALAVYPNRGIVEIELDRVGDLVLNRGFEVRVNRVIE